MYKTVIKRCLDFTFALFGLVLVSPILVVLFVTNAIVMKGNPIFSQVRPGIRKKTKMPNGDIEYGEEKLFKLYKMRSMRNLVGEDGQQLPDNQRLTKWGSFIRKTSLDELPELWNILKGDMSFVGPRPLLVQYLPRYSDEQRHRHDVKPGLTGWAQVNGRNAISWEEKFKLDVEYVGKVSFLFDLKIMLLTVVKVLKRDGISSSTSVTMEEFMGKPNE